MVWDPLTCPSLFCSLLTRSYPTTTQNTHLMLPMPLVSAWLSLHHLSSGLICTIHSISDSTKFEKKKNSLLSRGVSRTTGYSCRLKYWPEDPQGGSSETAQCPPVSALVLLPSLLLHASYSVLLPVVLQESAEQPVSRLQLGSTANKFSQCPVHQPGAPVPSTLPSSSSEDNISQPRNIRSDFLRQSLFPPTTIIIGDSIIQNVYLLNAEHCFPGARVIVRELPDLLQSMPSTSTASLCMWEQIIGRIPDWNRQKRTFWTITILSLDYFPRRRSPVVRSASYHRMPNLGPNLL